MQPSAYRFLIVLRSPKPWRPLRQQVCGCFLLLRRLFLENHSYYRLAHEKNKTILETKVLVTIVISLRNDKGNLRISHGILNIEPLWPFFSTAGHHHLHCANLNNKIKNRNWILRLMRSLVFSIDSISLKVTCKKWSKSLDCTKSKTKLMRVRNPLNPPLNIFILFSQ